MLAALHVSAGRAKLGLDGAALRRARPHARRIRAGVQRITHCAGNTGGVPNGYEMPATLPATGADDTDGGCARRCATQTSQRFSGAYLVGRPGRPHRDDGLATPGYHPTTPKAATDRACTERGKSAPCGRRATVATPELAAQHG